jgi:hypothetical protein
VLSPTSLLLRCAYALRNRAAGKLLVVAEVFVVDPCTLMFHVAWGVWLWPVASGHYSYMGKCRRRRG